MKKRLILTIILVSLFIPIVTNAAMSNKYDVAVAATNSYPQKLYDDLLNDMLGGFSVSGDSELELYAMVSADISLDFILNSSCIRKNSNRIDNDNIVGYGLNQATDDSGIPYDFINGKIQRKTKFNCGGLLSYDEFNISKNSENETYLYNGNDYWTMTEEVNKAYIITHNNESLITLKDKSSTSGVRITQYFDSNFTFGEGSYSNPWSTGIQGSLSQVTQGDDVLQGNGN